MEIPEAPQISIVLTVYNMQRVLRECLDGLQAQSLADFEVICVNDGSTDDSLCILREYAANDSHFCVIDQENSGPGPARNRGLALARGQYIIFLDSDDIFAEDLLLLLHQKAMATDADIVVCRSFIFDDGSSELRKQWWAAYPEQIPAKAVFSYRDMRDNIFTAFIGWPWDKLIKREFLHKHDLSFPPLANSEDGVFVFLALALAQRITLLDDYLIQHRLNRFGSVSKSRAKAPREFYAAICLIKQRLQQENIYADVSWGFLNWAFGYMIWNIDSMEDPAAKKDLLLSMANGEFAAIEYLDHGKNFFMLDMALLTTYKQLLREIYMLNPDFVNPNDDSLVGKFRYQWQKLGLSGALGHTLLWFGRRLYEDAEAKQSKHHRGASLDLITDGLYKANIKPDSTEKK